MKQANTKCECEVPAGVRNLRVAETK